MKTSLDIPDDLMRELRILAATEGRRLKEIVAESLRRTLSVSQGAPRMGVREIEPVSVGHILDLDPTGADDILEEMLDERGHRY